MSIIDGTIASHHPSYVSSEVMVKGSGECKRLALIHLLAAIKQEEEIIETCNPHILYFYLIWQPRPRRLVFLPDSLLKF